jgi:ribosomal protein L20A (L18A)
MIQTEHTTSDHSYYMHTSAFQNIHKRATSTEYKTCQETNYWTIASKSRRQQVKIHTIIKQQNMQSTKINKYNNNYNKIYIYEH